MYVEDGFLYLIVTRHKLAVYVLDNALFTEEKHTFIQWMIFIAQVRHRTHTYSIYAQHIKILMNIFIIC
jgi:hypothetical protein